MEIGWLIEITPGWDEQKRPHYLTCDGVKPSGMAFLFTANHLKAIRFARREDADQVRETFTPGDHVRSVEHSWG